MVASCRLCGYRGPDDTSPQSECPICGEAYHERQGEDKQGLRLARAANSHQRGLPQQAPTCLNADLQSLLHLIPTQQQRKSRAEEAVRAAGGRTPPPRAVDDRCDTGAVYIRPRVDPTMRVLKGRYKTQPRVVKAASMTALHRLAHPLMGYDSLEALAPQARRRRQESVERLQGEALRRGRSKGGGPGRLLNQSHSSAELSRTATNSAFLARRNSRGNSAHQTPMATCVNAVHLQRRKMPEGPSAAATSRRQCGEPDNRAVAASPLLRLRASEGRRAKPILRRKRVATMRSVEGWVREADPTCAKRQVSLERRVAALKRKGSLKPRGRRKNSIVLGSSGFGASIRNRPRVGDESTFLTEIETDEAGPAPETRLAQAESGGIGGSVGSYYAPRRKSSVTSNPARHRPKGQGRASIVSTSQRQQARKRSSEAERRIDFTETGGRQSAAPELVAATGRSGFEDTRAGVRIRGVGSVENLDRRDHRRRPRSRIRGGSMRGGAEVRGRQAPVRRSAKAIPPPLPSLLPPSPPSETLWDSSAGRDAGEVADGIQSKAGRAWDPMPSGKTHYGEIQGSEPREATREVPARAVKSADGRDADTAMAPAWDGLYMGAASPLRDETGVRIAWQAEEAAKMPSRPPYSDWNLLRLAGSDPALRAAELLRTFENKVGSPDVEGLGNFGDLRDLGGRGHRPDAPVTLSEEMASRHLHPPPPRERSPLPLSGGDQGGNEGHRHRHRQRRPLSRPWEEADGGGAAVPTAMPGLASMKNRPGSSFWAHRCSLPSLLCEKAESPAGRRQQITASTPPSPPPPPLQQQQQQQQGGASGATAAPAASATTTIRGKRRTASLQEPSGRMQRLDTTPKVTVGYAFAWGAGSSRAGTPGYQGPKYQWAGSASAGNSGMEREARGATSSELGPIGTLNRRTVIGAADFAGARDRGSTPSENLLSSATSEPLLYVGSGGRFRLTS